MTRIALGIALGLLIAAFQAKAHFKPNTVHNRIHAINYAFCHNLSPCALGAKAIDVAYCESGPNLWPYARNGQYLGMFQFGGYARSAFGFSWSPWEQSRAAYRYWRVSGWAPWQCA